MTGLLQRPQSTNLLLMIRPAAFGFNADTAASNPLQHRPALSAAAVLAQARLEFETLAAALAGAGVRVCVVDDTAEPPRPDAVFPNNWVSFHHDGSVVLYPMQAASRRSERRRDVVDTVMAQLGFRMTRLVDLSAAEERGEFLEGTGSLVLDHVRRVAYACRSPRTSDRLVERWCGLMGYEPIVFAASDAAGRPYYHTNVMLSIGTGYAIVAAEAIAAADRQLVMQSLHQSGREILLIDRQAVAEFAGNVLEIAATGPDSGNTSLLVMSASAREAFSAAQYARLEASVDAVLAVSIPTIENTAGGSVRCMLAEVFVAL